jgi:ESCRT-I complex subunit TSG101
MPMDTDRLLQTYMSSGGYKNQARCSQDILNAIKHYRGLQPRFDKFIFNDGSQKELICLQGTIPVPYRGTN